MNKPVVPPVSSPSEGTSSRDEIETPKPESRWDGKVVTERHESLGNYTLERFLRREIEERVLVCGLKVSPRLNQFPSPHTFYTGVERPMAWVGR